MYGVEYIETRTCGVTRFSDVYAECFENGVNGGHPTGVGQQKIGAYMTRLMQSKRQHDGKALSFEKEGTVYVGIHHTSGICYRGG